MAAPDDEPLSLAGRLHAAEAQCLLLQRQLAERDAQLAAARQDAEEFLHMVGHDLRAPLRHVLAYTSLLREMQATGEDPQAGLATLSQSAQRLGQMVDALVELARLGRAPLALAEVPCRLLVDEALRELEVKAQEVTQARAEAPPRRVEWSIADDLPSLYGDPIQLRLVWRQILGNALKFSRDCPVARVEVGWQTQEQNAQRVLYFVRDNGAGFNPAQADRLFQPFARLHAASAFEGLGTGLAQVRQILRRHGGSVRAEAGVGAGCTVWFSLAPPPPPA